MSAALGPSFDARVYNPDGAALSPTIAANLQATDALVRQVQRIVGSPLVVTSGLRSAEHNAEVGGVNGSQHLDGTAADVVFEGVPIATTAQKLNAAIQRGELQAGQVIYYPSELDPANKNHIHVSLPTRSSRNKQLIHKDGTYFGLSADIWPSFGKVALGTGAVLLVLVVAWLLWPKGGVVA